MLVVQRPRRVALARPRGHRARLRPEPLSLPSDHRITDGWFLSRSTIRRMRSTSACSHAGSSDGLRPPLQAGRSHGSRGRTRRSRRGRARRRARGSAGAADSASVRTALTLCAFISSMSRRMTSSPTARPATGSNSWRLTPCSWTRCPLTCSSPSSIDHAPEADPQRHALAPRSPRRSRRAAGSRRSTPRRARPSRSRRPSAAIPSSGTVTRASTPGTSTRSRPAPAHVVVVGVHEDVVDRARSPAARAASRRGRSPTATTCPGPRGRTPRTTGARAPRARSRRPAAGAGRRRTRPAAGCRASTRGSRR